MRQLAGMIPRRPAKPRRPNFGRIAYRAPRDSSPGVFASKRQGFGKRLAVKGDLSSSNTVRGPKRSRDRRCPFGVCKPLSPATQARAPLAGTAKWMRSLSSPERLGIVTFWQIRKLRICPRRATVLSGFCRLCLQPGWSVSGVAASMRGKSKVRRKQMIRTLLLNGVRDDVSAQNGSCSSQQEQILWR